MTKKKKWIIGGSITLGVIGVIILLLFTLFALKNVEIDYRTSTSNLTASQEEIVETCDFAYNTSVVFHSKKGYIEKLEKAYPYMKVINIETVFPNKFVIHVAEREEVYAIEKSENQFYIVDQEFKVLRFEENFESTDKNAIILSGVKVKEEKSEGEFLKVDGYQDIYSAFIQNNRLLFEQQSLVKEISFDKVFNEKTNGEEFVASLKLFSGQEVKIVNGNKMLAEKLGSAIQVYSQLYSLLGKEIKVFKENGEAEILGVWNKEKLDGCIIEINNYYVTEGIYYKVLPKDII